MMDRFVFPKSFYDSIKTFKPVQRDMLYSAIFDYVFEDKSTQFANNELARVWILIQPVLTKSKKISETKSEQCRDNVATMSGHSKDNVETTLNTRLKEKEKEYKDKGDTPKSPTRGKSLSRFRKPTVEEVRTFIQENNYHVNPNDFVNFYESKGWLVGKTPMKDWKAAVRTWESKEKNENPAKFVEEKDEYVPIKPLDKCKVCGSKNVITKGLYSMCNGCGVSYRWNNKWEEESL